METARVLYAGKKPDIFADQSKGRLSVVEIQGLMLVRDNEYDRLIKVTDTEFVRLRNNFPDHKFGCVCLECAQIGHVRNNHPDVLEIRNTASIKRGDPPPRGFDHPTDNNNVFCSLYSGADPLLAHFIKDNPFDHLERKRNLVHMHDPAIKREMRAVQQFYNKSRTGRDQISEEEARLFDEAMFRLASMPGAAEHMWAVAVATMVLSPPGAPRLRADGRMVQWTYEMHNNKINYPIEHSLDGGQRRLVMRNEVALCTANREYRRPHPLLRGGEKEKPVVLPATPDMLEKVIAKALNIRLTDVRITATARAQRMAKQFAAASKPGPLSASMERELDEERTRASVITADSPYFLSPPIRTFENAAKMEMTPR